MFIQSFEQRMRIYWLIHSANKFNFVAFQSDDICVHQWFCTLGKLNGETICLGKLPQSQDATPCIWMGCSFLPKHWGNSVPSHKHQAFGSKYILSQCKTSTLQCPQLHLEKTTQGESNEKRNNATRSCIKCEWSCKLIHKVLWTYHELTAETPSILSWSCFLRASAFSFSRRHFLSHSSSASDSP